MVASDMQKQGWIAWFLSFFGSSNSPADAKDDDKPKSKEVTWKISDASTYIALYASAAVTKVKAIPQSATFRLTLVITEFIVIIGAAIVGSQSGYEVGKVVAIRETSLLRGGYLSLSQITGNPSFSTLVACFGLALFMYAVLAIQDDVRNFKLKKWWAKFLVNTILESVSDLCVLVLWVSAVVATSFHGFIGSAIALTRSNAATFSPADAELLLLVQRLEHVFLVAAVLTALWMAVLHFSKARLHWQAIVKVRAEKAAAREAEKAAKLKTAPAEKQSGGSGGNGSQQRENNRSGR